MLTRPQPKMKTQTHRNVSKFYKEFRRISIFILFICLLCFPIESAFSRKPNEIQPKDIQQEKDKDSKKEDDKKDNKKKGKKKKDDKKDKGKKGKGKKDKPPKDKPPKKKITVCHKGEAIEISESALDAHIQHGDVEGPCVGMGEGTISPLYSPPIGEVGEIGPELTSLLEKYIKLGSVPSDDIYVIVGDKVLLEIIVENIDDIPNIISYLEGKGAEVYEDYSHESDFVITTLFPIEKLNELNKDSKISFVRPVYTPILKSGIATSQGDKAIQSDNARKAFDVDGDGVKVCVMSDSYNAKQKAQKDIDNGDLPLVDVSEDYPSEFGSHFYVVDEGRAMLQIIHDIAPGADLGFRTGFVSIEHMANGIHTLQKDGCNIIVDDITHLSEPFFKDGLISDAVNEVTDLGVKYFSSAGNFANWGYESQFSPVTIGNEFFHGFGTDGNIYQEVTFEKEGVYIIVLQWDDVYKSLGVETDLGIETNLGAENDLDISLVDDEGNPLIALKTNNLGGDPIEVMPIKVENGGAIVNIRIKRASGTGNVNFKYIVFVGGQHFTISSGASGVSTIVGQANAAGAYTVGAANYTNTPAYDVNPPIIEPYSSYGGSKIGSIDRLKPDFVAPDGVNTSVMSIGTVSDGDIFTNFIGTSAAAPHAAAVAALISHAITKFEVTGIDVGDKMKETALAMNQDIDYDYIAGNGFVLADSAIMSFAAPKPSITGLEVPGDIIPGVDFVVTIQGENLSRNSQVLLDGNTLSNDYVTYKDHSEITATINSTITSTITIESTIKINTPSITPSGKDGGFSDPFPIFYTPKIKITVTADDATKLFGELNPEFSATLLVDGLHDQSEIDRLAASIGFLYETAAKHWDDTEGQYCSPTGIYYIHPIGIDPATIDPNTLGDYDFEYIVDERAGHLTIEKLPITIKPITKENYIYGESFDNIGFEYDLYSDGVDDNENIDANEKIDNLELLLEYIQMEHRSTFREEGTNAIVDRARQLVNRARQLVNEFGWLVSETALSNRARQLVNGDISIDLDIDLLTNYIDPLTGELINPDGTIPNRARQLVNGEPFFNKEAFIKDELGNRVRQLVNEGGLGTIESEGEKFANITLIVDTEDATISNIYSVNLISGLDVNPPDGDLQYEGAPQYIVPGAFISPAADNFITTYTSTEFDILPADLNVKADDKLMFLEDLVMPKFTSTFDGFQYEDNEDNVFSSITYTPTGVTVVGEFPIIPDFEFFDEINYNIVRTQGVLTVQNIYNGQIAVTAKNDGSYDLVLVNSDGSNPVTLASPTIPNTIPGSVRDPEFSPNGMEIVFTSYVGQSTNLWKINSDGSGLTQLTDDGDGICGLADFSPDGTMIAFIKDGDVAFMDIDGNIIGIIQTPEENESFPFYAPDGTELYFTRSPGGGLNEIFKINLGVNWWPGDESVYDIVGGNHGTLQGGATYGPGQISQAFQLDGIDDFVMVPHSPHSPNLNFGTKDFTIDLWVNFINTDGEQVLIEKWVQKFGNASSGWTLTKLEDNTLRLALSEANESEVVLDVIPPSLSINTWNHVEVTREGDKFTMYWNGTPLGTIDCSYNLNSLSSLKMGHRGNPDDTPGSESWQGFYLNGFIDEVEIFDRALSALEIEAIFTLEETQITSDDLYFRQPDFFRDGSKILFTRAENVNSDGNAIMTMDPDGTIDQDIIYEGGVGRATVSPDGEKIAFSIDDDGDKDLYVIDLNGANRHEIFTEEGPAVLQSNWGTNPDGINYVNIPDPVFEQALIDLGFDSDPIINGQISKTDALRVDDLYVEHWPGNEKISNLTGIETFVNMWRLECQFNQLTSLDLSQNTALTHLLCGGNQLTKLDVSKNTNLIVLSCYENQLTSLDLSKNTELTDLICPENSLKSLDVTQNTALESLRCAGNELSSLDVSQNTLLWQLVCEGNHLTSLDLTQNILLTEIDCRFNNLVNLNIRNGNNSIITSFKAVTNYLSCISVDDDADHSSWLVDGGVSFSSECEEFVYIPNANFEQALITKGIDVDGEENQQILRSDAESVLFLEIPGENIDDLTGIEAFINLIGLVCIDNQLTDIDISNNTALTKFRCEDNQLTSLDVSNNTILRYLFCGGNELESLDVSNNTQLETLSLPGNQIAHLELSLHPELKVLYCYENLLTSLDVSQNTKLEILQCYDNQLVNLDVRNGENVLLTDFNAEHNNLSCISVDNESLVPSGWIIDDDVIFSNECEEFVYIADANFEQALIDLGWDNESESINGRILRSDAEAVTSLDVSDPENNSELPKVHAKISDLTGIEAFVNLTHLDCEYNLITNLDVTKNIALTELVCQQNHLTSLDVSQNTSLVFLMCGHNQLTGLDVSQNTALTSLYCDFNQITSLDVSHNTLLRSLHCWDNQITSIDVRRNLQLQYLNFRENQLTSLDVSQNTALRQLYCLRNQLSSIDVSQNTALYKLWCNGNQLKSLDVTKNIALIELICDFNELTSLDVSQNTLLSRLICRVNNLTELDITNNTVLTNLDCHYNELISLDLRNGNNSILTTLNASNNNLSCISVDDEGADHSGWVGDPDVILSNDCSVSHSGSRTITGTVTSSDDGSPVTGVIIIIKGTTFGVVTDLAGNYAMQVIGDDDILICSFIGYETIEVPTGNRSIVNITLDPESGFSAISASEGGSSIVDGNVTLYPNPVVDWVIIEFTDKTVDLGDVAVTVYNGQPSIETVTIIKSPKIYGFEVDFNSLIPGTYYLQLYDGIEVRVFRLLKE